MYFRILTSQSTGISNGPKPTRNCLAGFFQKKIEKNGVELQEIDIRRRRPSILGITGIYWKWNPVLAFLRGTQAGDLSFVKGSGLGTR